MIVCVQCYTHPEVCAIMFESSLIRASNSKLIPMHYYMEEMPVSDFII